jgi:hypothetical protein
MVGFLFFIGMFYLEQFNENFNPLNMSIRISLFLICVITIQQASAQNEKHRVAVRVSLGQSMYDQLDKTDPYNQGSNLRMEFISNIEIRAPFEVSYQYRCSPSQWIGLTFHQRPNYLSYHPQYLDLLWTGPVVLAADAPDRGLSANYEAEWTLHKTLKGYSRLSLGFYYQTTSDQASDYSWYQNAPQEFYNYATDVSSQGLRPYIPMAQASSGIRWKGYSLGYEVQGSLTPILNSNYSLGYEYKNPIRHYFIGLQFGYSHNFNM